MILEPEIKPEIKKDYRRYCYKQQPTTTLVYT